MKPESFDLNGDGNMEIVIRDPLDQTGERLVSVDGATYGEVPIIDYPSGATIASIPKEDLAVYDIDSDGLLELIVDTSTGVQVWVGIRAPAACRNRRRPEPGWIETGPTHSIPAPSSPARCNRPATSGWRFSI